MNDKKSNDLSQLVERVVETSLNLDIPDDYWERQGIMMAVMFRGHPQEQDIIRGWLDHAIATQTSEGLLSYGGTTQLVFGAYQAQSVPIMQGFVPTATCTGYFGYPLVQLFERTGDQRYLDAAAKQVDAILQGPRTSEGFLLMNESRQEIWVDTLYPVCGLFAALGRVTGRSELIDDAYAHLLTAQRRLIDPIAGLARHVWLERPNTFTEPAFWGRGNGFFICAAAEVLLEAPDHKDAPAVRAMLADMLASIAHGQDRTGFLFDYLDDPGTRAEASGTAMFAYAAGLAHNLGVVGDDIQEAAVRALRAVASLVDSEGNIGRITYVPGGPGVPRGVMVLGRSFFLLAAHYLADAAALDVAA